MGTNYYWHRNPCTSCGHPEEVVHIGKSSSGWAFALHVPVALDSGREIKSLFDWMLTFKRPNSRIVDEYGNVCSRQELVDVITNRAGKPWTETPAGYASLDDFLAVNNARIGQNNLLFPRDAYHPADATWYHAIGDFS